ncbi:MAG: hypothetical protein Ct9H300mP8_03720 [Gammaproteobacteria bacterium]|nr:MAG: hypothetical protein Ct9H300mP8_03720 [Gammaproteobacteria bacterium]
MSWRRIAILGRGGRHWKRRCTAPERVQGSYDALARGMVGVSGNPAFGGQGLPKMLTASLEECSGEPIPTFGYSDVNVWGEHLCGVPAERGRAALPAKIL